MKADDITDQAISINDDDDDDDINRMLEYWLMWSAQINSIGKIEDDQGLFNHRILESIEYFNLNLSGCHLEAIDLGAMRSTLRSNDHLLLFDSAITTHFVHVESPLASYEGAGYHSIGSCGQECWSSIRFSSKLNNSVALHYRHLLVNLAIE